MWMNYIYAKWKWKKQCFEIIAQKISAKNMNNDLVFFRDEIKIFLISWFETRSRFVSSTSRASRRDREFVPSNLEFRDGDEILKKISCGRARYLVAKSHEIFRDRDISPCSVMNRYEIGVKLGWPTLAWTSWQDHLPSTLRWSELRHKNRSCQNGTTSKSPALHS